LTLGSRTADDGGGEWAGSDGPDGSAPREGEGCALEEHCPGELMLERRRREVRTFGAEGVWRFEVSLKPLRPVVGRIVSTAG
jgi:hypothetical protein